GVAFGVAFGVASGVALGVAFILGVLRVYFWIPELLWMLFLRFFSLNAVKSSKLIGYLPPRFDEKIILPLPFMSEFITDAYKENPGKARETIDYLISSTNQQKVAAQAIVDIVIDMTSSCQTLGDIAEAINQLRWIPSPPPKELGNALPQLLDISQDVNASIQTTTTKFRRIESLNRPIKALQRLQSSLAFEKNPKIATNFRRITNNWLEIITTAQRTLKEEAQGQREIPQHYIAGNSLDPETAKARFKGRIDIFREIESLTLSQQPPILLLYGERRTGKTSALKYLPDKVDSTLVPLLVDLQGAASATTLEGLAENLVSQILEAARRLPRPLDLPYPNLGKNANFSANFCNFANDPFIELQNWLTEIERTHPNKRFLLCLDEFERLSEVVETTRSRVPLNFLRNVLQHRRRWTLLFSGSHLVSELPSYWNDYLINTRTVRVSFLDEESARELIVEPVEDFPKIYEPEAVDKIIELTHCQPYLVQLLCYEVVEYLNQEIRMNRRETTTAKATLQDIQTVIPTVLERGDQYFRELWTSLSEKDRNLLRRLVKGETPTQEDKGVVNRLIRKEILTQEGNAFRVPLVQEFVTQVIEEEC
ncbi:MAG: ATP-binding protein, partial [Scytonema sp. PMC 1070.18]|nr:ATP-binding protein [Scytonema sp. PMC 1070.18]